MALKDLCQSGEDNVSKSPQRCIMNSYDQCNGIKNPYFERSENMNELKIGPFWQGLTCFSPLLKSSTMRLGSSNHREYFKSSNSHRGLGDGSAFAYEKTVLEKRQRNLGRTRS